MDLVSERLTIDLALVVVPHRTGGETAEDQRRTAEAALAAVMAALVEPL